jgi:hypothetical protein
LFFSISYRVPTVNFRNYDILVCTPFRRYLLSCELAGDNNSRLEGAFFLLQENVFWTYEREVVTAKQKGSLQFVHSHLCPWTCKYNDGLLFFIQTFCIVFCEIKLQLDFAEL